MKEYKNPLTDILISYIERLVDMDAYTLDQDMHEFLEKCEYVEKNFFVYNTLDEEEAEDTYPPSERY